MVVSPGGGGVATPQSECSFGCCSPLGSPIRTLPSLDGAGEGVGRGSGDDDGDDADLSGAAPAPVGLPRVSQELTSQAQQLREAEGQVRVRWHTAGARLAALKRLEAVPAAVKAVANAMGR